MSTVNSKTATPAAQSEGQDDDQSFRTFLEALEKNNELVRFAKPVDPLRNMSAIEWKTYNELGKASLFTNIEGHPGWRACSQIVADRRKLSIGLGLPEETLLQDVAKRMKQAIPSTAYRGAAPVKAVRLMGDDADLTALPAVKVSERDSARYIPSGIAFVKDPETGVGNLSLHRMEIKGPRKSGFVMLPRHARRIYDKYSQRGLPTPIAIVIGVHPAIWISAGYTTGPGIDELGLAGGLLGLLRRALRQSRSQRSQPRETQQVAA